MLNGRLNMYLLNGVRMKTTGNPGTGRCGSYAVGDLLRLRMGLPCVAPQQRHDSMQELRDKVAEFGLQATHRLVGFGEFAGDLSFGEFNVEEIPVEQLLFDPRQIILKRSTWVRVARDAWLDGKHVEAAAVVSDLENFRFVKATEAGELVPCYGANDLQAHFPMVMWHEHGHFEAVFKDVPQLVAQELVATKDPPAARKPAARKVSVTKKSPVARKSAVAEKPVAAKDGGNGWTVVGKNRLAKKSSAFGKVCAYNNLIFGLLGSGQCYPSA